MTSVYETNLSFIERKAIEKNKTNHPNFNIITNIVMAGEGIAELLLLIFLFKIGLIIYLLVNWIASFFW